MCIDKKHKNKIKMNLLIHKSIFRISRMQQSVRGGLHSVTRGTTFPAWWLWIP